MRYNSYPTHRKNTYSIGYFHNKYIIMKNGLLWKSFTNESDRNEFIKKYSLNIL